ncbi:MAG TPA: fructosamine kinase family protein [Thermoanaerobaculia bacterium]|nr:fructosamine kinase family protein [Thermoanaerobaculia bacterium]
MNPQLTAAIEAALAERRGAAVDVVASRTVSGGCIHDARLVELADGQRFFLKADVGVPADLFEREAEGLAALAAVGEIRVPAAPLPGRAGDTVFLLMEAISTGRPGSGFFADFGRRFARFHRASAHRGPAGRFGFDHDNYLGGTPQPNPWCDDWTEFFRRHRLAHQLELARRGGRSDPELHRLGERLLARLGDWLDVPEEPACLLHGDLWSGNFLADDAGAPVLVDPAVYRGHREADLAMTHLFGGFDAAFHRAYEEEWPLPPGSAERLEIYQLYHLLNHLNLFGAGYRGRCLAILRRYAG